MEIGGKYVQYSKLFVGIAGVAYLMQVVATIVLVCVFDYASSALLEILGTTTGLIGLFFGCYTGNSATEKWFNTKTTATSTVTTTTTSGKKTSG